jgi:hypothetical protein
MADFSAFTRAWYFTPDGTLRECIVTEARVAGDLAARVVIDAVTGEPARVDPADVLVEQPE